MEEENLGHLTKLSIDEIDEEVFAEPQVECPNSEVLEILANLKVAVEREDYISPTPTLDNPSLSDDYIFDTEDVNLVLKDLTYVNFVGKIKDVGKGAKKRVADGLPQEYLYVFKYPCKLQRRDADDSQIKNEKVLIYIKINNRKVPYEKIFIISFHKNRIK